MGGNMENSLVNLETLLQKDERLTSEGELLKNKIIELALKLDKDLIKLLLSDKKMKEVFFADVDGVLIFDKDKFVRFVSNKQFLPNSYTAFKNKIGLTVDDEYITEKKEVVLSWPYKDCVLEGEMTKEDQKRDEVFWNEILAPDEISRLIDPKVFTNAKRIDKDGEHSLYPPLKKGDIGGFRTDENGDIKDNLIIKGNNLLALHSLKKRFAGRVKLIYIDPPYNTGTDEFKYNDAFNHSSWLTFMKNRLGAARDLLSVDGSIYINIDFNEAHYLKVLMDEIFGRGCFQREIIWRIGWVSGFKTASDNYIRNHDTILFYSKSNKFIFNKDKACTSKEDFVERFNADAKKEIVHYLKNLGIKNKSRQKDFLDFMSYIGLPERYPLEDTWNCSTYDKLNSIAIVSYSGEKVSKMLGCNEFKGQKAEKLLKRIIELSTNTGDIVLDFFSGTGTTCAVAHKIGRQYICVEQMEYIDNIIIERMKEVIKGEQTGISKSVGWKGGGDFVYLELMKWNENFVGKIRKAKTKEELKQLWETMKEKAFLSYKVDIKTVDEHAKDFADLSIENQKRFLLECLDKNHLYVNYSEIDDEEYGVSEEDKKLNKNFYHN
jgi:adenine-specific DNA-methyltransferase